MRRYDRRGGAGAIAVPAMYLGTTTAIKRAQATVRCRTASRTGESPGRGPAG
ncbi:MAG: hypothetical protein U0133_02075 [Gemmatimonadales bacterium]